MAPRKPATSSTSTPEDGKPTESAVDEAALEAEKQDLDAKDKAASEALLAELYAMPPERRERMLHRKLADIAVIAERIPKRGTAPREMGGYKFVQVGDAADFIRTALGRRHISMQPVSVEITDRNEHPTSRGGVMTTLDGTAIWLLTDGDTGETATIMSFGAGSDTGDKYSGKLMTSLMKYALLSGFQLSTGEDTELSKDADDKVPGQPAGNRPPVEHQAGRPAAAGGRQQTMTQPQSKIIGDLLRAAGAGTTGAAIELIEKLTGDKIEKGDDPNAALATYLQGREPNARGKLIHDLQKHVDGFKGGQSESQTSTEEDGSADSAESATEEPAAGPDESLEVDSKA